MAIIQELDKNWFVERFKDMGRENQFTFEAKEALFDYLDNLSDALGEDIKMDVIALCCDWYESTPEEVVNEYSVDVSEGEAVKDAVDNYLQENTTVIDCGETFLYQAF